jgi:Protein kinase domain/AAA ATPase domain
VEVYDYGLDAGGPYYTMELLDGGDLQQLAPLDWRKACALARDVCSALSLLHSRRLVYRDLSPRNIRCTGDGLAKLIDFGGMTPMGPNADVIGTPPCAPPELLDFRPLDARTDLYALGATLYYALVRRHAFPARTFGELRALWGTRPLPPSTFVSDLPEALDQLVMELLHFDSALRPASAAEVMERLSALLGSLPDEHLRVHQAYLSTPTLVGRETQLDRVRERVLLAPEQLGSSVLIHGADGVGRSRVLDACALEAKLSGMLVLRAEASGAEHAPGALLRVLAAQLLAAAPELALAKAEPYLFELASVLPELRGRVAPVPAPPDERVLPVLLSWLKDVAEERPLLIAVDDVGRLEPLSAALVLRCAEDAPACPIGLVVTATSADARASDRDPPVAALARISTLVELSPLDAIQTKQLLGSVFGEVPNLHALASYVDQVAAGNPRDVMRLVQHLVGEQLILYECGSWSLPEHLPTDRLPSSMAEARRARLSKLSAVARRVAYAFACEPRHKFTFDECLQLSEAGEPSAALAVLRELLDSAFILRVGPCYRLAQLGFFELLASALPSDQIEQAHRCLARFFEEQADGIRAARHLFRCGEEQRGLEALLADSERSRERTGASFQAFFELLKMLPSDWIGVYDQALLLCEKHQRPHHDRDVLLGRLGAFISHAVHDTHAFAYLQRRLARLSRDAGLDLYASLPEQLEPAERLRRAFEQATVRHRQTPAQERGLAPQAAIKPLVSTLLGALGSIACSNDFAAFQQLPSLAPLAPLSPAISVVDHLARGLGARITGRSEQAIAIYDSLLVRMNQADRAGLQTSEHLVTRLRVLLSLGALEASMGLCSALERVEPVARELDYETQALMLRNLCQLWQGQAEEAARTKRRLEIRKGLRSAHHGFDGQYLLSELCAYAAADDLTHLKQATDTAASHAAVHAAWLPVVHFGRGELHRMRADGERALAALRAALALMPEGQHQIWPNAAGALLRTLVGMRRHQEALALGESYLERARGLGYARSFIEMPLSLALCGAGQAERAQALAEGVIGCFLSLGSTGLNLAQAYETRARVAAARDDRAGFEHFAALSAAQWPAGSKRLLGLRRGKKAPRKSTRVKPRREPEAGSRVRLTNEPAAPAGSGCVTLPRAGDTAAQAAFDSEQSRTIAAPDATASSVASTQDDLD